VGTTFTSESVTESHPNRIGDRVSDAVLDDVVTQNPTGRVACETLATVGMVMVGGKSPPAPGWTSQSLCGWCCGGSATPAPKSACAWTAVQA
jgi:hypothetical protein